MKIAPRTRKLLAFVSALGLTTTIAFAMSASSALENHPPPPTPPPPPGIPIDANIGILAGMAAVYGRYVNHRLKYSKARQQHGFFYGCMLRCGAAMYFPITSSSRFTEAPTVKY